MDNFLVGGFTPFTLTDYPGRIAAIVFTQGCNLACPFCHNRSLIPYKRPGDDDTLKVRKVFDFLAERRSRLQGVVITGGEPTLQRGLIDFLKALRSLDYQIKLDTNGTRPDVLAQVLNAGLVDFVAMDLKAPWSKYSLVTETALDVDSVKESFSLLSSNPVECLFRTTFVPGLLDEEDLREIRAMIPEGVRYKVQDVVKRQ